MRPSPVALICPGPSSSEDHSVTPIKIWSAETNCLKVSSLPNPFDKQSKVVGSSMMGMILCRKSAICIALVKTITKSNRPVACSGKSAGIW